MPQIREQIDADLNGDRPATSTFPTDTNTFELVCGACARHVFAGRDVHDRFTRAFAYDPDNRFLCDDCIEESEEAERVG